MRKKYNIFSIILACLILGYCVRIVYLIRYPVPVRDSYTYADVITECASNPRAYLEEGLPPLGLYLLKLPDRFLGIGLINGGKLLNVELGLVLIALIILIVHQITASKNAALAAGIIAATHPTLTDLSCQMLRDNSFLFFTSLLALLLVLFMKRPTVFKIAAVAICGICSVFCRFEGIENIVVSFLAIMFFPRHLAGRRRLVYCFAFLFASATTFFVIMRCTDMPMNSYSYYLNKYHEKIQQ